MMTSKGMTFCGASIFAVAALAGNACSSSSSTSSDGSGGATSGTGAGTSSSASNASSSSGSGAGGSSSSSAASSSSSSGSGSCTPPTADAGALACPAGKCAIGNGGYEFVYGDMGPMTTYCAAKDTACAAGTLTPANPPSYSYYGAGFGINLGPAVGMGDPAPVQLTGTGITIKLSNMPSGGARLAVTVAGVSYCAPITTNPATITWAQFNTKCYDSPPDGVALTGAPATPHVEVNLPSGASALSFDFCVEQLTLTTM
jgi:hypothetical protein